MHFGQRNLGQLMLCGWPGLAHLWLRGGWASLALAIGFSVLLNIALVATFAWPTLLGNTFPAVAWAIIAVIWMSSVVLSYRMIGTWSALPVMAAEVKEGEKTDFLHENESDTLFNRAQGEYLKGNWQEAESLLKRQLNRNDRDVEARLLIATLYRHTRQLELARTELDSLQRFDESIHWEFEIGHEYELINQIESKDLTEQSTSYNKSCDSDQALGNPTPSLDQPRE